MTNKTQPPIEPCALPISKSMKEALSKALLNKLETSAKAITLNFRDLTYTAESGGYHPVEIRLVKSNSDKWQIYYITDFAYIGNIYPELERSVDFDIENNECFFNGIGWQPISTVGVSEFYQMWEGNFLSYLNAEAYDSITLSED